MDNQLDAGTHQQSQDVGSAGIAAVQSAQDVQAAEKLIPQSELNKIVGRVREEARQDGYARARAEMSAVEPQQSEQQQGYQSHSRENIEQLVAEKIKEQAQLEVAKKIAGDFTNKLLAAKEKYPDFEETVAQLNLPTIPQIVHWANSLDNTADVMYDIAKNPAKFANILMLSNNAPLLAQRELQKLSSSIKKNEEAKSAAENVSVGEPLSQLKPSVTGTDNGKPTIRDLRKQSWMRA
jgi:hypothetical protein